MILMLGEKKIIIMVIKLLRDDCPMWMTGGNSQTLGVFTHGIIFCQNNHIGTYEFVCIKFDFVMMVYPPQPNFIDREIQVQITGPTGVLCVRKTAYYARMTQ